MIRDKIEQAKLSILDDAIKKKKVSKALNLIIDEVLELAQKTTIEEQCEILSKALNLEIKFETYKSFYYRNVKPKISKNDMKIGTQNDTPKEPKKSQKNASENQVSRVKSQVSKVAPKELKNDVQNETDKYDINRKFQRRTKPEFKSEDF